MLMRKLRAARLLGGPVELIGLMRGHVCVCIPIVLSAFREVSK